MKQEPVNFKGTKGAFSMFENPMHKKGEVIIDAEGGVIIARVQIEDLNENEAEAEMKANAALLTSSKSLAVALQKLLGTKEYLTVHDTDETGFGMLEVTEDDVEFAKQALKSAGL